MQPEPRYTWHMLARLDWRLYDLVIVPVESFDEHEGEVLDE